VRYKVILFSYIFLIWGSAYGLEPGEKALPFTLSTATGKKIDILNYAKSQKKRNLLLVFFRTGNCGICVHQLVEFSEQIEAIQKSNAAVLAVSLDDAIVQTRTSETIQNKFPILLDPQGKAIKAYGVYNPAENLSRPSLFLIGPDKKILYRYVGQAIQDRPPLAQVMTILSEYSGTLPRKVSGSGN
jgi:peroxiredoxin